MKLLFSYYFLFLIFIYIMSSFSSTPSSSPQSVSSIFPVCIADDPLYVVSGSLVKSFTSRMFPIGFYRFYDSFDKFDVYYYRIKNYLIYDYPEIEKNVAHALVNGDTLLLNNITYHSGSLEDIFTDKFLYCFSFCSCDMFLDRYIPDHSDRAVVNDINQLCFLNPSIFERNSEISSEDKSDILLYKFSSTNKI